MIARVSEDAMVVSHAIAFFGCFMPLMNNSRQTGIHKIIIDANMIKLINIRLKNNIQFNKMLRRTDDRLTESGNT